MWLVDAEGIAFRALAKVCGPACVRRTIDAAVESPADCRCVGFALQEEERSAVPGCNRRQRGAIGAPDERTVGDDAAACGKRRVGLVAEAAVDGGACGRGGAAAAAWA